MCSDFRAAFVEQSLGFSIDELIVELRIPPAMGGCRAFAYPIPPERLLHRVTDLQSLDVLVALLTESGGVTVHRVAIPTVAVAPSRIGDWAIWAPHLPDHRPGRSLGLDSGPYDEIDTFWREAVIPRIGALASTNEALLHRMPLAVAAEDRLMAGLDHTTGVAALPTGLRRTLPHWIGDRYRLASYLVTADEAVRVRRQRAWTDCPGPVLDALREAAQWADLIDAIDRGRALRPALCKQLGVKPWVYDHLTNVTPAEVAWHWEQRGTEPMAPPSQVFAQGIALLPPDRIPESDACRRKLFTAACVLHDLPPAHLRAALLELIELVPLHPLPANARDAGPFAEFAQLPGALRRWWLRERSDLEDDSPHGLRARMRAVLYASWLAGGMQVRHRD